MPDILLLIGMKARTGELLLESGNNIGSLVFHEGNILQAFSPYSRAIGDQLVEGGLITEAELLEALNQQKQNPGRPIGKLLMNTGKVSLEIIEALVHEQIRQSVKEFSGWDPLHISFINKEIKRIDRIQVPVQKFISPGTMEFAQVFFASSLSPRDDASSTKSVAV